jgi:YHS domain-containing protein
MFRGLYGVPKSPRTGKVFPRGAGLALCPCVCRSGRMIDNATTFSAFVYNMLGIPVAESGNENKKVQKEVAMEGLGSLLLFALFFYLMMRYGCGAHMIHGHGGDKHEGHDGHGDADGAKFIDPVCDMEVELDQGYGMMYKGNLYRFCSRNCLDKFDHKPEKYLAKKGGTA